MADEIVSAGLTINVDRNGGTVSLESEGATDILKELLEEIKKGNDHRITQDKKKESGLIDAVSGGASSSIIKQTLSALGISAGLAGAAILGFTGANAKQPGGGPVGIRQSYGFAAAQGPGGEDQFIKIDKKTGEILDILDKQEAEQLGILDNLGNITNDWKATNVTQNAQLAELEKSRDKLVLTNKFIQESLDSSKVSSQLDKEINEAKKAYRDKLKRLAGLTTGGSDGQVRPQTDDEIRDAVSYGGNGSAPFRLIDFESNRRQEQIADSLRDNSQSSGSLYIDVLSQNIFGRQ